MIRFLLIIIALVIVSCTPKKQAEKYPDKLVIGFPVGSSAALLRKWYEPVGEYLKKALNLKSVEFYTPTDYAPVIEAMKANKVDIAYYGELSYIIAHEKAGADALVMMTTNDGSPLPTNSAMITYPETGIHSMDDVKKRSHELTIAFADPASTSGHLYPRDYLNSLGLDPEKSFKQVVFSDGHLGAILSIKSHKVDIACTILMVPNYMVSTGKLSKDDFRILWISKPYPAAPVSIRRNLPEGFKKLVKQAFLDFQKNDPKDWNKYLRMITLFYPTAVQNKIKYVEAEDSVYNCIRRVAKEMPFTDYSK
jgi:phosphonate transport system substrate-binding protein